MSTNEKGPQQGPDRNNASTDNVTGPADTLPEAFWKRATHDHIRQAAHSRGRSADVVFYATLARLSAMVSPKLRLDAGLGEGSLNLFVAIVGPSSSGKSTGTAVARDLIAVPAHLKETKFSDGIGVGTGEGLAEAYMGYETRDLFETKRDGTPKTEKVRAQVRENVFVFIDEGQSLTQMISRIGTTIGPVLRSAWAGELLGQANAREETTRHLPAGSYSLGLVIGYQPETAQPLLADAATGTPQRFLWASATDPNVPDMPPQHPGPLRVDLSRTEGWEHQAQGWKQGNNWEGGNRTPETVALTGVIEFAEEICQELWQRNLGRVRGQETDDNELDAHASFMWCKVAALLSLLDGRAEVTQEDWELSKMVWATSCVVRDQVAAWGQEKTRLDNEARHKFAGVREQRVLEAREDYEDHAVHRVARLITAHVLSAPEGKYATEGTANKALASRDRKWLKGALTVAKDKGWVTSRLIENQTGPGTTVLVPGESRPA